MTADDGDGNGRVARALLSEHLRHCTKNMDSLETRMSTRMDKLETLIDKTAQNVLANTSSIKTLGLKVGIITGVLVTILLKFTDFLIGVLS